MQALHLFGLRLTSELPLTTPMILVDGASELTFAFSEERSSWVEDLLPAYQSPLRLSRGESISSLYRINGLEALAFPFGLEYLFQPKRITGRAASPQARDLVEGHFLGPVLSYWLERQGIPTLHASAINLDGRAVGFLSAQRGGKSGLAAAFLQAGHPLLTDDILPIEESAGTFLGRSGYPQMRMWPDEAAHFLGGFEDLPRVHPQISKRRVAIGEGRWGTFQESALPLAALYVPERREGGPIEIEPLSRSAAVIELVRQSFSPHLVQAVGLQPSRLDLFARLVRQVPVRRLLYPSGFERLPEVVAAVRGDLLTA
jgi:hypothetical protein